MTLPHQYFDIVFNDGDDTGARYRWTPTYDVEAENSTWYTMRVTAGRVEQLGFGARGAGAARPCCPLLRICGSLR